MTLSTIVSQNLRTLRSRRRLTQGTLAAKAGVCLSYISMLERGLRSPPLETLEALAKALHVPPRKLFEKLLPGPRSRGG